MVGKLEIGKDTLQELAESSAGHVGRIATIVAGAVRAVAHEFGEWAGDAFEIRDAAGRAAADHAAGADGDDTFASEPLDVEPFEAYEPDAADLDG